VLDRLRTRLQGFFAGVGATFSGIMPSPTGWTVAGILVSVFAATSYARGGMTGEVLGGVLVLVAGWFDVVDGAVARVTGKASMRGAFLDSTLDRLAEFALFAGILIGGYASPLIVLVALSFSLLVSYTRAKGEALGVKLGGVGIGERSERLLVLAVSSIMGYVGWGLVIVFAIALFTFMERSYTALLALRMPQGPEPTDAIGTWGERFCSLRQDSPTGGTGATQSAFPKSLEYGAF
jgi:archaetidylinositol phosphate synthase